MAFYDKVNELCRERGISITALALAIGFSKGTPSNWKTMTKPPRADSVKKVAEYFGVPVSYFSDTNKEKTPPEKISESEVGETVVIYHRDGKTVRRELTPEQMKMLASMIDAIPEEPKGI